MIHFRKKIKGFTLIEIMLTVAVMALVGSMISGFFLQIYRSYSKTDAKAKVTQVTIATLGSLQKQIREVSQAPTCITNATLHPTSTSILSLYVPSLTDPTTRASDDIIQYYLGTYNNTNVLLQRLVRGGQTYPAIPALFDFDAYRTSPNTQPVGGGVAASLADPTLIYEDAAFYYDSQFQMICVGITVSVADRGRSGVREKLTLTSAISIRNTF
jgi:prepilin-type N-terminal cleavage/methylation domain-containing protein